MWTLIASLGGWLLRLILPSKSNERKLGRAEAELDSLKRIREAEEKMDEVPRDTRADAIKRLRKNGL